MSASTAAPKGRPLGKEGDLLADPPSAAILRLSRYVRRERIQAVLRAWHVGVTDALAGLADEAADEYWKYAPTPCKCAKRIDRTVPVYGVAETRTAHYSGLATCKSVWCCPVCSAVIRNERATEVQTAADAWTKQGNSTAMGTFTVRHKATDALEDSLGLVLDAWRRMNTWRGWRSLVESMGLRWQIRAVEITWRYVNGWHPHLHVLFFFEGQTSDAALEMAQRAIHGLWDDAVSRTGGRPLVEGVGAVLTRGAAGYVLKVQEHSRPIGSEMVRFDLKGGRAGSLTPFELVDQASTQGLFGEFYQATRGRHVSDWSKGMKAFFGLDPNRTDDEIVEQEYAAVGLRLHVFEAAEYDGMTARERADALAYLEREHFELRAV